MLSHFNFILSQEATLVVAPTANKNVENKQLKSPAMNGAADHVAFVIHGIGQQTEQFGFFQHHLQCLHDTTQQTAEENNIKVNIEYIPIEWHKHIHEETDTMMDDITPQSIPKLRMINNDYLADAFFYLSKDRGQSIINHVTQTLNEAYNAFMNANPGFNGKIAILAYSLGGIIAWDILSNQTKNKYGKLDLMFPTLNFKPDYLFTLGSPLSAFLTVRNQDPKLYHPHPSIIFENIFHPYDPLGYRFEPMIKSEYKSQPAVLVEKSTPLPCSIWDKGRELLSKQQRKWCSLLSSSSYINDKEKKQNLHSAPRSGNVLDTLKSYFHASPPPVHIEEEEDVDLPDSSTSTPKLSLDCISEEDEDELEEQDYFMNHRPQDIVEKEIEFKTSSAPPFMYIRHTDMSTNNKRRHFEETTTEDKCKKRKTLTLEDIELLNTTITKGAQRCIEAKQDPLPKRIDFVLQPEKILDCLPKNEYVSGLTAHFSYWTHKDLMWHIVCRLENH